MKKHLLITSLIILTLLSTIIQAQSDKANWKKDLQYLAEILPEYHKDFKKVTAGSKYDSLITYHLSHVDEYSYPEFVLGAFEIMASLNVAHSYAEIIKTYPDYIFSAFPVKGKWYSDGFYLTETTPEYSDLLGRKLLKIGSYSVNEVMNKLSKYIACENDKWLKVRFPLFMLSAELLSLNGMINSIDSAEFIFDDLSSVKLNSIQINKLDQFIDVSSKFDIPASVSQENEDKYYSFSYIKENKLIYFQYNTCGNEKGYPFSKFNDSLFAFIDTHDVGKIVIDLRYNEGGNSAVLEPFMKRIAQNEELNVPGHFFAMIGNRTFSSALLNTLSLKMRTKVITVGEPTGGKPNSWGEQKGFTLPYTKVLMVSYCSSYYSSHDYKTDSYYPDIPVSYNFSDYINGKDPVLEKIIEY